MSFWCSGVSIILWLISKTKTYHVIFLSHACWVPFTEMPVSLSILTDCIEIFNIFLDVFTHYLLISQVKVMYRTKGHLMNYWCKGLEQKQVNDYQCKVESQLYLYLYQSDLKKLHLLPKNPTPFSAHTLYNWAMVVNYLT